MTTTNPDERPPASADPALAGALTTLRMLNEIGPAAFYQDGTNMHIAEAAARAAVADAVTNRIRLLGDLLSGAPDTLRAADRTVVTTEHDRLVRAVTRGEA